ncbi:hypothetical protein ACQQ2N_08560 [Dokdonella sp. MW10]|uniref:hypothetical protein n=1 Tax=Dokdonella sp. MW10 TaxID=2992926 RepID=UPI003F8162DE
MRARRLAAGTAAVLVSSQLLWTAASTWWRVDACLDASGSYDYAEDRCGMLESHPYATASSWWIVAGLVGGIAGTGLVISGLRR